MEILTKLLRHDHRASELYMDEDEDFVYLMRGSKILKVFSAEGATVKDLLDEADKNTYEVIGR